MVIARRWLGALALSIVVFLFLVLSQPWSRCGQSAEAPWARVAWSAVAGAAVAIAFAYLGGYPLRELRAGGFRHLASGVFFGGTATVIALLVFLVALFIAMGLPGVECAPRPSGWTG